MVNFYILKKCLVYWRFERITRNCRKYDIRLLCVEFIRWQCACKQRACNARDKWDLLTSFLHVKSYGYIFFYWSASAAYVSLDAPGLDKYNFIFSRATYANCREILIFFPPDFFMIIKNIPKSICLPRTLRPDILKLFLQANPSSFNLLS